MPLGTLVQFMLPRWVVARVAPLAGHIAYALNRKQRGRLLANARHVLGPSAPEAELARMARRAMVNVVMNYLDLLRVPVLRRQVGRIGEFDPVHLDAVMARGRGTILVTPHLGNWDLAGTFLAARGYPISAVVEPIPRGWTTTFNRYRSATSLETIPIPDRRGLARAMQKGRLIALVADRDLTGRGVVCTAFDARRAYPKGPAAYALKYGLPVVLGYLVFQNRPGRPPYFACVEPPLDFQPSGDMDADVVRYTHLIAATLNRVIGQYPDQWLVFNAGWQ
jgi:lauroyl/myristoyl acyltransferase